MRLAKAVPGIVLLLVAAGAFLGTAELSYWNGASPGARFFPAGLAVAGAAVGLLLLWAQWRGVERVEIEFPDVIGAARVAATVAALAALAYGAPRVGVTPMLVAFVLFMLLGVLRRRLLPSLAAAAVVAGLTHLVFIRMLSVPLPTPFGF